MANSNALPNPTGGDASARATHRALKQDEVKAINQDLLQAVLNSNNLRNAWKRVKANKGAPGIDGVAIEEFPAELRVHWPELRTQIKEGRYQPQAVRRVEIPKPDGGKRMLGIWVWLLTVMDRIIQQACRSSAHANLRSDLLGIELWLSTGL